MGYTLRRLATKCAGLHPLSIVPDILAHRQFGFGVSRGIEAAVHAARIYLQNLKENLDITKMDFTNAFNSIRWDKMLCAVKEYIPEFLPFVHSVHCSSSFLSWENEVLLSSEGILQGDPMGPLLFGLTIHKLSAKMRSEFAVFYLDDGTLGGNKEDIHDIKNIEV